VRMISILRQITVLNCILLVCILAFAYFILAPIFTVDVKVPSASSAAVEAVGPEKGAGCRTGSESSDAGLCSYS